MFWGSATVGSKGQVVIPAEAREALQIKVGDKLLVMVHPSHTGVVLIKPDGLEQFATQMLEQLNDAKNTYKRKKK